MKKRIPILCLILLIVVNQINGQTGTISGNVYWKYNDYVGNKADAGSDVSLVSLSNPEIKLNTTCDLQGNYKLEGIAPGRYFLIVKSKNTRQDPVMFSRLFEVYKFQLDSILGIKISGFRIDMQAKIDSLYKQQFELVQKFGKNEIKMQKYLKEDARIKKDLLSKIEEWFNAMPMEQKLKLNTASYIHDSFHYQIIDVQPNKNETVVTDFGVTYL